MLKDIDIEYRPGEGNGVALVWVIDGECLYDLPLNLEFAEMFLSITNVEDVSDQYPENQGLTLSLFRGEEKIDDFNTSEYFGSILLSNPLVLNLADYPYGRYVESPRAQFDGEKFLIFSQDVTDKMPWAPGMEK